MKTIDTEDLQRLANGSSVYYGNDGNQEQRIAMARELLAWRSSGALEALLYAIDVRDIPHSHETPPSDDICARCRIDQAIARLEAIGR